MSRHHPRLRFWVESGLCLVSVALLIASLVVHDWAELIFGIEPDQGSGAFELVVTVVVTGLAPLFGALGRLEWRRWVSQRAGVRG